MVPLEGKFISDADGNASLSVGGCCGELHFPRQPSRSLPAESGLIRLLMELEHNGKLFPSLTE